MALLEQLRRWGKTGCVSAVCILASSTVLPVANFCLLFACLLASKLSTSMCTCPVGSFQQLPTFACSMYNWSFHLKRISSQTSSLHQSLMFPYTHALLYSKNICPHLLTKFQVSKVTANLTEVCSEFDHVWWTHSTLNWSVQWVWPCMSLEEHQK